MTDESWRCRHTLNQPNCASAWDNNGTKWSKKISCRVKVCFVLKRPISPERERKYSSYDSILLFELLITESSPELCECVCACVPGTSTPPGISASTVTSITAPIGVNGFSALPAQNNGQPTPEPIYTNGLHPYPGEHFRLRLENSGELCLALGGD